MKDESCRFLGLLPPLLFCLCLASCALRPGPDVLKPTAVALGDAEQVTVLAATNRRPVDAGYDGVWAGRMSYERFDVSVPRHRKDAAIDYPAAANPDPDRQFIVRHREPLSPAGVAKAATSGSFDGTAGIFVHGYNYSYQEALFRTVQVTADAESKSPPILFSWPSAASVAGYVADRDAVLASRTELQALVSIIARTPKVERLVLFGHSMGGFLVMEAVRELKLQGRRDVLDKLVIVLAAPDIDVDVFRSQLRDIGRMKTPITMFVSKNDRALMFSSTIAGERARVGRLDVSDRRIAEAARSEGVRVVDITSVQGTDGLGHDRYAAIARYGKRLSSFETERRSGPGDTGAFVFNAAGSIVASQFRLVGGAVGGR